MTWLLSNLVTHVASSLINCMQPFHHITASHILKSTALMTAHVYFLCSLVTINNSCFYMYIYTSRLFEWLCKYITTGFNITVLCSYG